MTVSVLEFGVNMVAICQQQCKATAGKQKQKITVFLTN